MMVMMPPAARPQRTSFCRFASGPRVRSLTMALTVKMARQDAEGPGDAREIFAAAG